MDRIDLAQARDRWWALANAVVSFKVVYHAGNFLINFSKTTLLM